MVKVIKERTEENDLIIECYCGNHVELYDSWATPCDRCGAEYNGSGQILAPRSQWGEETGEDFTVLSPIEEN